MGGRRGTSCATCHGTDGLTEVSVDFDAFPGFLSNDNPQEFIHKARFGHPGTGMKGMYDDGATAVDMGDLGAYSQSLPCASGPMFWPVCQ